MEFKMLPNANLRFRDSIDKWFDEQSDIRDKVNALRSAIYAIGYGSGSSSTSGDFVFTKNTKDEVATIVLMVSYSTKIDRLAGYGMVHIWKDSVYNSDVKSESVDVDKFMEEVRHACDVLAGDSAIVKLTEGTRYTMRTKNPWFAKVADYLADFGIYSNDDYEGDVYYIDLVTITLNTKHIKNAPFTENQLKKADELGAVTKAFKDARHFNFKNSANDLGYSYPNHEKQVIFMDRDKANAFCNYLRKLGKDPMLLITPYYVDTETIDNLLKTQGRSISEFQGETHIQSIMESVPTFQEWLNK